MRIVDKPEAIAWLSSRGLLVSPTGRVSLQEAAREESYPIPPDSQRKTVIARELADWFSRLDESMLWINEFAVWEQNWYLFDGFRKSLGESRLLIDSPGHIFASVDVDAMSALLSMVLYFDWGAALVPSSGELLVRISHHEFIDVFAKANNRLTDDLFDILAQLTKDRAA